MSKPAQLPPETSQKCGEPQSPHRNTEPPLLRPGQAWRRRFVFFGSVLVANVLATLWLADWFWMQGLHRAHAPMLVLFFLINGMLTLGAAHALFGWWAGDRGPRAVRITDRARLHPGPLRHRYAVVMPIYEEDCERFCARLEAIYHSLHKTGAGDAFDFFLLSDTRQTDLWIQEEIAWTNLCRNLQAFGRIFYRRRTVNTNRKAGNIADFVRKTGGNYEAMLVLDADSLMEGADIVRMAQVMEMSPRLAILQTPPKIILGQSIFARAQQFIMAAVGPLFVQGLNYWQLGEGTYWGHNALVRLRPFSEFCELPALPGKEPFGGRIFSHDFVEAALLVRAGWEVWLAWDIQGTYEESPPTLVDHLVRDRRWCQGNLQHLWLLMARKLRWTVRMHLLGGVMGYLSSPFWFLFLSLGMWLAWDRRHSGLSELPFTGLVKQWFGLSPDQQMASLLGWVAFLLLLPRLLATARILQRPELRQAFGGASTYLRSLLGEFLLSVLLAPIMMIAHSQSVFGILLGRSVAWNPQSREGAGTSWSDACRFHAPAYTIGLLWAFLCWQVSLSFFLWMLPVTLGLLLSVPISVWTSRPRLGQLLSQWGFWQTPEQRAPSEVIALARQCCACMDESLEANHPDRTGFIAAAIDPYVNAVHLTLAEAEDARAASAGETSSSWAPVVERCLRQGPSALTPAEKEMLLQNPSALLGLHRQVWLEPGPSLHPSWHTARESYRFSSPRPPVRSFAPADSSPKN